MRQITNEGGDIMKVIREQIKKVCVLLLSGFLCVLLFLPVFSADASGTTGTVKNRVLNVRKEASTTSSIVCKLSQGTKVSIVSETTGTDGMKWYRVSFSYNGGTYKGYVRADLLNVTSSSSSNTQTSSADSSLSDAEVLYVKNNSVRVREQPSTSSATVAGLVKDNAVDVRGIKTGTDGKQWIKVSFTKDGQRIHGYIRSDLLTAQKPANIAAIEQPGTNNGTSQNVPASQNGDTLYVSASAVRVREEPSESAAIIANLLKGDEVRQKSVKTGTDGKQWTKVSFSINGTRYRGYVRSDYLTTTGSASASGSSAATDEDSDTRYITVSAVRVRDGASEATDIVANLLKGDQVSYRSVKTGGDGKEWTKIAFTLNGTKYHGYVRSDCLSRSKPSDSSQNNSTSTGSNTDSGAKSGTVRLAVINMRQSATTSSGIVAKIKQGTKFTIISETTGSDGRKWYYGSCVHNGNTVKGYVRSDLLNM